MANIGSNSKRKTKSCFEMILIKKEEVISEWMSEWCKRAAYGGGDSPLGERPALGVKGSELHIYMEKSIKTA